MAAHKANATTTARTRFPTTSVAGALTRSESKASVHSIKAIHRLGPRINLILQGRQVTNVVATQIILALAGSRLRACALSGCWCGFEEFSPCRRSLTRRISLQL